MLCLLNLASLGHDSFREMLAAKVLRLLRTARQMVALNRTFGSLFIAMALMLATFKRAA